MSIRKLNKIIKETKRDMEILGTYRPEFDNMIKTYADIVYQYDTAWESYMKAGCPATTECVGGIKKHPTAIQLEDLRKQKVTYSDRLGLNPKALDSLRNAQQVEVETGLEKAMGEISDALKGLSD